LHLGSKQQLAIRIGRVPLLLHAREGALLETAARRYSFFRSRASRGLPISLERAASIGAPRGEPGFQYQLGGRSLALAARAARFTGVNTEYDLDSLLRILLSVLLVERRGCLLHAATVVRDGQAYVFMGRSGAGKSTVASLAPAGSVLTDEISLLRGDAGIWRAYGTPFWGEFRADGQNRSAPLAGIFALAQAPRHRVQRIPPRQALAGLLGNTLFFAPGREPRERLLGILAGLLQSVPVYRLEFQKEPSFWEVLP
jgi:hypothetical protein